MVKTEVLCQHADRHVQTLDGIAYAVCKRCQTMTALPDGAHFILPSDAEIYGCEYCADRVYRTCPHETCPYQAEILPFTTFEKLFRATTGKHLASEDMH